MAEEIVTRFTADLSDLQAKVKAATSTLEGYAETADEAGNAIGAQGKKVGDLEAKTKTLVATEQALTTATKEVTKATVEAGAKGAPAIDKLTKAEKAATVEAKKLATAQAQVGKTTEGTGAKLSIFGRITQGLSGAFGRIKTSVVEFGRGAKAGFQEAIAGVRNLGGGIGAATSSFGTFGSTALGLLGPIGLGVGALATGLLAVARNTDAGTTAIDGFGRGASLVFDRVTGNVKSFFSLLESGTAAGNFFDGLIKGATFFVKTLSPIAPILALLKVTGISDAFAEDVAEGQRLAQLYDDLEDKQIAVNEATAKNQIIIDKNLAALRDGTKTTEERLALAEEAAKAERANLELRRGVLKTELDIAEQEAASIRKRKDEIPDELKARISALKVALLNEERESIATQERISARANNISEQDFQKEEARRAKDSAARDKAFNEEKQRIEKLSALREQAAQTREELERDALRRQTLGEDGAPTLSTQILDVDFRVEDQIDAAKENAKRQEELAKGNAAELERIAQDLADTIALIRQRGNEEVDAITSKFYKTEEEKAEAAKDRVTDTLLSDTDRQIAAVNKQYDALLADLSTLVLKEDELNALRVALNKKRQEELNDILTTGRDNLKEQLLETGAEFVGEAAAFLATSQAQLREQIDSINETYAQQLLDLQKFAGTEAEIQEERARINGERNRAINEAEKAQGKQRTKILLDTLQKVLTIMIAEVVIKQVGQGGATGGVPGAIAGEAQAAIITALLQGVFSALLSSIGGAYMGERNIGGAPDIPGVSRDQYIRRVDRGEDIVRAKMAKKHRGPLDAIHDDKFDQWLAREMAFTLPDFAVMPAINNYLEGDTGQRMTAAISLPRGWDRGTVEATNRVAKEQKHTNDLLLLIAQGPNNKRSLRSR